MSGGGGYLPDAVIEQKAYKLLTGFEGKFGTITEPPIPINKIVERHLDLWFDWDDIDDTEEEKILAFLDPSTKKIRMNTRRRDHFERYLGSEAFTQAHEVGHWEMHVQKDGERQLEFPFGRTVDRYICGQGSQRSSREIQADRFAAYLLMPSQLIRQEVDGLDLMRWSSLYELNRRFGVTITALQIRLQGMGLIYVSPEGRLYHTEDEFRGNQVLF